ncbi:methylaspartate mutase accessory protein GlmL [[Eubacterium] cellulosolvens]
MVDRKMLALTVDFGSTFTKAIVIDLHKETIIARSISPSTVDTDINIGLQRTFDKIKNWRTLEKNVKLKLACSSAAGGLRIAAIGLVPELTGEAAKQAALGAGGKIIGIYTHKLTKQDLKKLEESKPDIILLTGGTDGGDRKTVEHNSHQLAESKLICPIVVACNREAAYHVIEELERSFKRTVRTDNVMPELGKLNTEPAKTAIRELFLKHIIQAKGLEKAKSYVDVLMPTPSASLEAASLLSTGTSKQSGIGNLMIVEVGGATTNVYSVFDELPSKTNVIKKGIKEEKIKRTVEGDLGVRINAPSLIQIAGIEQIQKLVKTRTKSDILKQAQLLARDTSHISNTKKDIDFDDVLTRLVVRLGVERHVGRINDIHTPSGKYFFQTGKDFESLKILIGTGGPIVYSRKTSIILNEAIRSKEKPHILKPRNPKKIIDNDYILWSMGLISRSYPDTALRMLKRSLKQV